MNTLEFPGRTRACSPALGVLSLKIVSSAFQSGVERQWDATDIGFEVGWGTAAPYCLPGVSRDRDTCSETSSARLRSLSAGMPVSELEDFTQKLAGYKPMANASVYCRMVAQHCNDHAAVCSGV